MKRWSLMLLGVLVGCVLLRMLPGLSTRVEHAAVAETASGAAGPAGGASLAAGAVHEAMPDGQSSAGLALRRSPVVEVFEANKDAVVNISSTQIVEVRSPWDAFFDTPGRQYRQTSVGSGFVLHEAGYIVTNAHVVARTAERKVIFSDQQQFPATIVAIDQERDLAVLKIDPGSRGLKALRLGRSADLLVGETVIAVGNPLGYQNTCTTGIISATDRKLEVSDEVRFEGLIQTDASINPGNSGGPLLNVLGELIGVNTAIRGDAQNIGFAIPVDQLRAVLPEMLDIERRYRIIVGLRLDPAGAPVVAAVEPGSPAQKAGLLPGDTITAIDQRPVASGIDYHINLLGDKAGQTVHLRYQRAGQLRDTALTLAQRARPDGGQLLDQHLGFQAQDIQPDMARAMGVEGIKGLIVTKVDADGPAGRIGLRRGDLVIQIGRHPASSLDDVGQLLENIQPGQLLRLGVLRISGNAIYRSSSVLRAR